MKDVEVAACYDTFSIFNSFFGESVRPAWYRKRVIVVVSHS